MFFAICRLLVSQIAAAQLQLKLLWWKNCSQSRIFSPAGTLISMQVSFYLGNIFSVTFEIVIFSYECHFLSDCFIHERNHEMNLKVRSQKQFPHLFIRFYSIKCGYVVVLGYLKLNYHQQNE